MARDDQDKRADNLGKEVGPTSGRTYGGGGVTKLSEGSANDSISRCMQPDAETGAQYGKRRRQTQREP